MAQGVTLHESMLRLRIALWQGLGDSLLSLDRRRDGLLMHLAHRCFWPEAQARRELRDVRHELHR